MRTPGFVFYPAAVGRPLGAARLQAYPLMDTETAIVGIIIIVLRTIARASESPGSWPGAATLAPRETAPAAGLFDLLYRTFSFFAARPILSASVWHIYAPFFVCP